MGRSFCLLTIAALIAFAQTAKEAPEVWWQMGKKDINEAWSRVPNYKVAKNLILMVGDGMGLSSVTASRIYKGQMSGASGEETKLTFERFPYVGLSKTYNVDRQVPDSAGTANAMATGYKSNYGTLGITSEVPYGKDCTQLTDARKLTSVLDYALEDGKSVGLVTSTRITHATPAAFYAHVAWRDFENDAEMVNATNCNHVKDIAYQLIKDNPNIQVILGGGRREFTNTSTRDPRDGNSGKRIDGRNLIEEWQNEKARRSPKVSYKYVTTKGELDSVDVGSTDYLLGLFTSSHMAFDIDRDKTAAGEPSLTEMAQKAIGILQKNPNGFFLLIEGGRIDHAHHDNKAKKSLEDTVEFDNAVKKVTEITSADDTLTIVTADHSHVFSISGYPSRGNPILGLSSTDTGQEAPIDQKPYLTLGYINGPASPYDGTQRANLTGVDTAANEFQQPGCINMPWETHGGEDVAIYAQGPMAHLIHSTHEQSYIGHVLMYSACLGKYKADCDLDKRVNFSMPVSPLAIWLLVTLAASLHILH